VNRLCLTASLCLFATLQAAASDMPPAPMESAVTAVPANTLSYNDGKLATRLTKKEVLALAHPRRASAANVTAIY
jgi:hypothetical protein